jgi:flagellar basal-body rod protein FlgG
MNPALRAAASGMMAQQLRTEVISNNLANVNTTGFKRSRAHFEDLLYQTVQGAAVDGAPDAETTPAVQIGRGVRLSAVQRHHAQGTLEQTHRALDLAIAATEVDRHQLTTDLLAFVTARLFGPGHRPSPEWADLQHELAQQRAEHRRRHVEALVS